MFEGLSQSGRQRLLLAICSTIFLANFLLGNDFGAFRRDYFEAHVLAMIHLHQRGSFVTLLQTIPNSASGVLPLWLYGFVDGIIAHKICSLAVFLGILAVVYLKRGLNTFSCLFLCSLLLSPMIVSSVTWVLPEVFALFLILVVFAMPERLYPLSVALSGLVPWARQTFVTHLGNRLFYLSGSFKRYFLEGFVSGVGLLILYRIWGGLVPPKLAKVHLTPSLKSFTIAALVFSLYFLYDNLLSLPSLKLRTWRLPVALGIAAILVFANLHAPLLYGGGYIFSRLESKSLIAAGVIEFALYALFFFAADLRLVAFTVISSASFATTNYFFLKYADFYVFAFLGYGLTELTPALRETFNRYAKSVFLFQCASLALAYIFYLGMK